MTKRIVLSVAVAILLLAGVLPLLLLLVQSVSEDGKLTLDAYRELLSTRNQWILLGRSLLLSALCVLVSTVTGTTLAFILGKTDFPWRRTFILLYTLPLFMPPYIMAVSWFHILGREGLVRGLLGPTAGAVTSDWLFALPGCVWILSSIFSPVVMLLTLASLRGVPPRLEEAGRTLAPWTGVLRHVTIPMILPAVILSALLVFILTLGEFGVPHFLRVDVFPVEFFTQFAAFYDFRAATVMAMPLIGLTLLALLFERQCLRKKSYLIQSAAHGQRRLVISLSRPWRVGLLTLVSTLCFMWTLLPLLTLLFESLSFSAYPRAWTLAGRSLMRSLVYSTIAAMVLTMIGLLMGYLVHNRSFRFWLLLDSVILFLFALPGAVLGIGLILLWNRPLTQAIYASPIILLLGLVAKYAALTHRISVSTLGQIPASMEEAACMVGARWLRRFGQILIPLARPGLIVAWLTAFLFCMRDTELAMLVYPPGCDTLPVRTFTLMANGSSDMIAALCMIMVLGTLIPLGLLSIAMKGFWRGHVESPISIRP